MCSIELQLFQVKPLHCITKRAQGWHNDIHWLIYVTGHAHTYVCTCANSNMPLPPMTMPSFVLLYAKATST